MSEEVKRYLWTGALSPCALFIGISEKPIIPKEGLPCYFFKSNDDKWCFDLRKERGLPHLLYRESVDRQLTINIPKWYAETQAIVEGLGVIDQKWSKIVGNSVGSLYTVTPRGLVPAEQKLLYLQELTGMNGTIRRFLKMPKSNEKIGIDIYVWSNQPTSTLDTFYGIVVPPSLIRWRKRYVQKIVQATEEVAKNSNNGRFIIRTESGFEVRFLSRLNKAHS